MATGSEAAASLAQMAVRSTKDSPKLAQLVRERQDLLSESQVKDKQLIATRSEPPTKRNANSEKAITDRLATIDARMVEIDRRLAKEFPDYAALAHSSSVSIREVQADLAEDEALVLFLDTDDRFPSSPEETFIWVVTKLDVRWVRSALGTAGLAREVLALRCGLDAAFWIWREAAELCAKFLDNEKWAGLPNHYPFTTLALTNFTCPFSVRFRTRSEANTC